jgi:hypothetical protein
METRNGSIWVVWSSDRTGNYEILYRTSPDHGLKWTPIVQLTNDSSYDTAPAITQNIDGTIWIVWSRNVEGNYDIFYKTSSDYGLTWSNATRLTTHPSWDLAPSITHTYNGTIWIVWSSYRTDDYEIFYKTSSDNGLTWSNATRLTTDAVWDITPSILQAPDGTMWVFWTSEKQTDNNDIFYKTSSDFGLTWSDPVLLVSDPADDQNPAVTSTSDRRIWLVWHSTRTGDFEVFFKFSEEITSVHDVAVVEIVAWAPPGLIVTSASRGTILYVNVTVENQGTFNETFNVKAYADRITEDVHIDIGTQSVSLANGTKTTLTFAWDTKETPTGSYFLSAEATVVFGEFDTADNTLERGAYIGGIFDPPKGHPVNPTISLSLILTILFVTALALGARTLFKQLMSVKPRWPLRWRQPPQRP